MNAGASRGWRALVVALAAFLAATAAPAADRSAPADEVAALAPEEYAVLGRVIAHGLNGTATAIVIASDSTGIGAVPVRKGEDLRQYAAELGIAPDLFERWVARNRGRHGFTPSFTSLTIDCALMNDTERAAIFAANDAAGSWERFFTRYPGAPGFLRLSRPALDDAHQSALVYVEFHCGPECGSGRLVTVTRAPDGEWQVAGGDLVWMAGS